MVTIQPPIHTDLSAFGGLTQIGLNTKKSQSIKNYIIILMDSFNFADAVLCIFAQRLIRTFCKDCKEKYHPSQKQYDELVREYGPEDLEKNVKIPYTDDLTLYKPVGCGTCNNTGYKGRMGVHELLMETDEQKRLIQNYAKIEELRNQTVKDGMTTLKQDGIEKIFAGHSDFIQVRKVCIK